jgi:hypothetical protein
MLILEYYAEFISFLAYYHNTQIFLSDSIITYQSNNQDNTI